MPFVFRGGKSIADDPSTAPIATLHGPCPLHTPHAAPPIFTASARPAHLLHHAALGVVPAGQAHGGREVAKLGPADQLFTFGPRRHGAPHVLVLAARAGRDRAVLRAQHLWPAPAIHEDP